MTLSPQQWGGLRVLWECDQAEPSPWTGKLYVTKAKKTRILSVGHYVNSAALSSLVKMGLAYFVKFGGPTDPREHFAITDEGRALYVKENEKCLLISIFDDT